MGYERQPQYAPQAIAEMGADTPSPGSMLAGFAVSQLLIFAAIGAAAYYLVIKPSRARKNPRRKRRNPVVRSHGAGGLAHLSLSDLKMEYRMATTKRIQLLREMRNAEARVVGRYADRIENELLRRRGMIRRGGMVQARKNPQRRRRNPVAGFIAPTGPSRSGGRQITEREYRRSSAGVKKLLRMLDDPYKQARRAMKGKTKRRIATSAAGKRKSKPHGKVYCDLQKNKFYRLMAMGKRREAFKAWQRGFDTGCAWALRSKAQALAL